MGDDCEKKQPMVEGKIEIFECVFPTTRSGTPAGSKGFDANHFSTGPTRTPSTRGGSRAASGRAWVGLDDRPRWSVFRWLASYRSAPYEAAVQGVDEVADAGWQSIEYCADIGLHESCDCAASGRGRESSRDLRRGSPGCAASG